AAAAIRVGPCGNGTESRRMTLRKTAGAGTTPGDGCAVRRLWFAQGLRAVACLLVVVAHYFEAFLQSHQTTASLALFPPLTELPTPGFLRAFPWLATHGFPFGGVGVALFFLVSGFVIPFSLQKNSLGGFFVRRFFRLYPTLWVALLLILGILAFQ